MTKLGEGERKENQSNKQTTKIKGRTSETQEEKRKKRERRMQ